MHMKLTGCCSCSNRTHPDYKIVRKDKFFCITASSNVWVSHQDLQYTVLDRTCTWHGQAVKGLQIQPSSGSKFSRTKFSITASSNVWVSRLGRPHNGSDISCTWHGQAVKGLQIQFTSDSPRRIETKIFQSRHVRMSWCRIRVSNTLYWTAHAHGTDRQSKACKSNPPLDPNLFSRTKFSITASSNVWVSCRVSRYVTSYRTCTWHCQGVVSVPIEPTSGSKLVKQENFFLSRQVRMPGCHVESQDT